MKTTRRWASLAAITVTLAGCTQLTTTTDILYDPVGHTVRIKSPKDVNFSKLSVSVSPAGEIKLEVEDYSSDANAEVMRSMAEARQSDLAAIKDAYESGIETAKGFAPVPLP